MQNYVVLGLLIGGVVFAVGFALFLYEIPSTMSFILGGLLLLAGVIAMAAAIAG